MVKSIRMTWLLDLLRHFMATRVVVMEQVLSVY